MIEMSDLVCFFIGGILYAIVFGFTYQVLKLTMRIILEAQIYRQWQSGEMVATVASAFILTAQELIYRAVEWSFWKTRKKT